MHITRRRFLTITAAATGLAGLPAKADALYVWYGTAMGSAASIRLAHPDAEAIVARALAEIDRLEDVFSLYRAGSALSRLNLDGRLEAPPFELLECLALAGAVHGATGGLFDPTIQPLWVLYAQRYSAGEAPRGEELAAALARMGWPRIGYDSAEVTLAPGMALTLNGIAQGYVADKVADLLREDGLTDVLIDTGELRALGGEPGGGAWPVTLAEGGRVDLRERALATSSPLGTVFDTRGQVGHILDPRTGHPAAAAWQAVSISAPSAALADALSTAACLMPDRDAIDRAAARFGGTRIEALV